jgi:hypothetical protein
VDQCDNCAYGRHRTYGSKQVLECRHLPPVAQGQHGQWPECQPTDWCGEYEPIGSDPANIYVNGNFALTGAGRSLLISAGDDPVFNALNLLSTQITNTANQTIVVFFYDSNDISKLITQVGCKANDSVQSQWPQLIPAYSGEIWIGLDTPVSTVYVSAQAEKIRGTL